MYSLTSIRTCTSRTWKNICTPRPWHILAFPDLDTYLLNISIVWPLAEKMVFFFPFRRSYYGNFLWVYFSLSFTLLSFCLCAMLYFNLTKRTGFSVTFFYNLQCTVFTVSVVILLFCSFVINSSLSFCMSVFLTFTQHTRAEKNNWRPKSGLLWLPSSLYCNSYQLIHTHTHASLSFITRFPLVYHTSIYPVSITHIFNDLFPVHF